MDMPSPSTLRLLYGYVFRLFVSLFLTPIAKAFPKLEIVIVEPFGIGHVLAIGQSYPANIVRLNDIGID